jgi:hypothetical protein
MDKVMEYKQTFEAGTWSYKDGVVNVKRGEGLDDVKFYVPRHGTDTRRPLILILTIPII